MEAEMRTQLRRQAAAHTDHVQDVLKVQEQELRAESEQVFTIAHKPIKSKSMQISLVFAGDANVALSQC